MSDTIKSIIIIAFAIFILSFFSSCASSCGCGLLDDGIYNIQVQYKNINVQVLTADDAMLYDLEYDEARDTSVGFFGLGGQYNVFFARDVLEKNDPIKIVCTESEPAVNIRISVNGNNINSGDIVYPSKDLLITAIADLDTLFDLSIETRNATANAWKETQYTGYYEPGENVLPKGEIIRIIASPTMEYENVVLTVNGIEVSSPYEMEVISNVHITAFTDDNLFDLILTNEYENVRIIFYDQPEREIEFLTGVDVAPFGTNLTYDIETDIDLNMYDIYLLEIDPPFPPATKFFYNTVMSMQHSRILQVVVEIKKYDLSIDLSGIDNAELFINDIVQLYTGDDIRFLPGENVLNYGDAFYITLARPAGKEISIFQINNQNAVENELYTINENIFVTVKYVFEVCGLSVNNDDIIDDEIYVNGELFNLRGNVLTFGDELKIIVNSVTPDAKGYYISVNGLTVDSGFETIVTEDINITYFIAFELEVSVCNVDVNVIDFNGNSIAEVIDTDPDPYTIHSLIIPVYYNFTYTIQATTQSGYVYYSENEYSQKIGTGETYKEDELLITFNDNVFYNACKFTALVTDGDGYTLEVMHNGNVWTPGDLLSYNDDFQITIELQEGYELSRVGMSGFEFDGVGPHTISVTRDFGVSILVVMSEGYALLSYEFNNYRDFGIEYQFYIGRPIYVLGDPLLLGETLQVMVDAEEGYVIGEIKINGETAYEEFTGSTSCMIFIEITEDLDIYINCVLETTVPFCIMSYDLDLLVLGAVKIEVCDFSDGNYYNLRQDYSLTMTTHANSEIRITKLTSDCPLINWCGDNFNLDELGGSMSITVHSDVAIYCADNILRVKNVERYTCTVSGQSYTDTSTLIDERGNSFESIIITVPFEYLLYGDILQINFDLKSEYSSMCIEINGEIVENNTSYTVTGDVEIVITVPL